MSKLEFVSFARFRKNPPNKIDDQFLHIYIEGKCEKDSRITQTKVMKKRTLQQNRNPYLVCKNINVFCLFDCLLPWNIQKKSLLQASPLQAQTMG